MRILLLSAIFWVYSTGAVAQLEGADDALQQQLTAQEQKEYQAQMKTAQGDGERKEIDAQYRKKVQERSQLQNDQAKGQHQGSANRTKGQGQGNPSAGGKSQPAGSKSKPQKSGK